LEKFNDIPEPFNEIMFDMMLQIMGWLAEEESRKKSERVKIAYQNKKGEWGRKKEIGKKTINKVLELYEKGYSIRKISKLVSYYDRSRNEKTLSKSSVQKIINENRNKIEGKSN